MNICHRVFVVAAVVVVAAAGAARAESAAPSPAPKGAHAAAHKHRAPVYGKVAAPVQTQAPCTLLNNCLTLVGVAP